MSVNTVTSPTLNDLHKLGPAAARKWAVKLGIPRTEHPPASAFTPPTCTTPGCNHKCIVQDWHWTTGNPVYRSVCQECHDKNTAKRYAVKTGAGWVKTVQDVIAHKNGYQNATEYKNSKHPYLQFRKDYCENIDGRLGFTCTTTIIWSGQLDVDHIDENPSNNVAENLQTLCKCCHAVKSNIFIKTHGKTPGRKALGVTKSGRIRAPNTFSTLFE